MFIGLTTPYWQNPKIHNFGNGKVHAQLAPFATKLIDKLSYDDKNVRQIIHDNYISPNHRVCDLCCGVGYSTFPNSIGIDTSEAMILKARTLHKDKTFFIENAETFGKENQFDITTIMFAMHEIPRKARITILNNAIRISKKGVIICDISTKKIASPLMLSGEPYLLEYQKNILYDIPKVTWENKKTRSMQIIDDFIPQHVLVSFIDL